MLVSFHAECLGRITDCHVTFHGRAYLDAQGEFSRFDVSHIVCNGRYRSLDKRGAKLASDYLMGNLENVYLN